MSYPETFGCREAIREAGLEFQYSFDQLRKYRLLNMKPVFCLVDDDRPVRIYDLVSNDDVSPDRQAMHKYTVGGLVHLFRIDYPASAHVGAKSNIGFW